MESRAEVGPLLSASPNIPKNRGALIGVREYGTPSSCAGLKK